LCRDGVETQRDGHLDLVTAILARPDMTDLWLLTYADHFGAISRSLHSLHAIPERARLSVPVVNMTTSLMLLVLNGVGT
jgi:hypothetical protein